MSKSLIGGKSAPMLFDSPNETLQLPAVKDELSNPILTQHDLAMIPNFNLPPLFQRSAFTDTADKNSLTDVLGIYSGQDLKFVYEPHVKLSRQHTLDEALTLQVSKTKVESSVSYHTVSETIVNTICEGLDRSSETVSLIRNSKTTDKITQIIKDFVSDNFVMKTTRQHQEISFVRTQLRSQVEDLGPDRTTLDFYANILPFDLVKRAKEKLPYRGKLSTKCVAVTKKKSRCGNKSHLNELMLNSLVQELSSIPKPRSFSKVIKALLEIANMVFCKGVHLKEARLAIYTLCDHSYNNTTSLGRQTELNCLDQWLGKLCEEGETQQEHIGTKIEDDESKDGDISSKSPHPLASNCADTSKSASMPQKTGEIASAIAINDLFLFEDEFDLEKAGFKKEEFTFAPSLTHKTLQPYVWPIEKRKLTAKQLVNQIIQERITEGDRDKRGYVYVYRHVEGFGYVKIGHSVNVGERLESWETQCKYLTDEHKDLLQDFDRQAPNPKRLEALIHAELKDRRFQVLKCEHCGRQHREWFSVNGTEAQRIVKKWTNWMKKGPYDKDGYYAPGEIVRPVLGDCEYIPPPPEPKFDGPRSRSARRSSNQRQSNVASWKRHSAPSTHHMKTRSMVSRS